MHPARGLLAPAQPHGVGTLDVPFAAATVRAWYPAAVDDARGRRWRRLARRPRDEDRLDRGQPAAPAVMQPARLPVVLYFCGWPGSHIDNFALLCHLAGHGFIVLGVTYPKAWNVPWDHSSDAAHRQTVEFVDGLVRARARDAVALLGTDSPLAQRMDPDRVGIMGFSFGGAVAAEAATLSPQFRGVLNLDGRHWGDALHDGVRRPYLYMGERLLPPSEADCNAASPQIRHNACLDREDYAQLQRNLDRHGGIRIEIPGAGHMDFTDEALRWRLRRFLRSPGRHGRRVSFLVRNYALAFFRSTLLGEESALLARDAVLQPEAHFAVWNR
jgi:dienelactone hydrolase